MNRRLFMGSASRAALLAPCAAAANIVGGGLLGGPLLAGATGASLLLPGAAFATDIVGGGGGDLIGGEGDDDLDDSNNGGDDDSLTPGEQVALMAGTFIATAAITAMITLTAPSILGTALVAGFFGSRVLDEMNRANSHLGRPYPSSSSRLVRPARVAQKLFCVKTGVKRVPAEPDTSTTFTFAGRVIGQPAINGLFERLRVGGAPSALQLAMINELGRNANRLRALGIFRSSNGSVLAFPGLVSGGLRAFAERPGDPAATLAQRMAVGQCYLRTPSPDRSEVATALAAAAGGNTYNLASAWLLARLREYQTVLRAAV
jgi:hypothetical protein